MNFQIKAEKFIFLGFVFFVLSQNAHSQDFKKDSLVIDYDTTHHYLNFSHGSKFINPNLNALSISKAQIQDYNYFSINEILIKKFNFMPATLGYFGQNNRVSVYGSNPESIEFQNNSLSMNNGLFGNFNYEQYSADAFEKLEIFTGTDAAILGTLGKQVVINSQQKLFNTKSPYTRIWYMDAGSDMVAADGILSQNILSSLNFNFGFKSIASRGEYINQKVESWMIRSGFNYMHDSLSNLSLNYIFINHHLGMNGGLEYNLEDYQNNQIVVNPVTSLVKYTSSNTRNFTNRIQLDYTNFFDTTETNGIKASFSYSNILNENLLSSKFTDSSVSVPNKYYQNSFRANIQLDESYSEFLYLLIGGNIYTESIQNSYLFDSRIMSSYSGYSKLILKFSDNFNISGGTQIGLFSEIPYLNIGGKINYQDSTLGKISFDVSSIESPIYNFQNNDYEMNTNVLMMIDFNKNENFGSQLFLRTGAFDYNINHSNTTFTQVESQSSILGFSLNTKFLIATDIFSSNETLHFDTKGIIQSNFNSENNLFDNINSFLYVCVEYKKTINNSIAKLGFEWSSSIRNNHFTYLNATHNFGVESFQNFKFINNGINFYASLTLGNAFLKANLQNALSINNFSTIYYPELQRNFRFSVGWTFND